MQLVPSCSIEVLVCNSHIMCLCLFLLQIRCHLCYESLPPVGVVTNGCWFDFHHIHEAFKGGIHYVPVMHTCLPLGQVMMMMITGKNLVHSFQLLSFDVLLLQVQMYQRQTNVSGRWSNSCWGYTKRFSQTKNWRKTFGPCQLSR